MGRFLSFKSVERKSEEQMSERSKEQISNPADRSSGVVFLTASGFLGQKAPELHNDKGGAFTSLGVYYIFLGAVSLLHSFIHQPSSLNHLHSSACDTKSVNELQIIHKEQQCLLFE